MPFEDKSQQYLENGYGLGRGYASSLRLNLQHHLFQKLLGYNIHPEIYRQGGLPNDPKIADVGTGTAQWLIDISHDFPSAQLDGFDISSDQFPTKAWLPNQITLDELDITKPIPSSLEGKYDVVHIQLFLCVVKKDGPDTILKELSKMLSACTNPISLPTLTTETVRDSMSIAGALTHQSYRTRWVPSMG